MNISTLDTQMTGTEISNWYKQTRQNLLDDMVFLENNDQLTLQTKVASVSVVREKIKELDDKLLNNITHDIKFLKDRGFISALLKVLEIVQDSVNKIHQQ